MGDIPEHWTLRRIASFSPKITNGWVGPTRDILSESGTPYIQSLHIKSGAILFNRKYYVKPEWLAGRSKIQVRRGDVLLVQTGDIGQVACVPEEFEGAGCHALIIIGTNPRVMTGDYLDVALRSRYGFDCLKSIQTGALHPHLNCTWVREIVLPVPPLCEQARILATVRASTLKQDQAIATTLSDVRLLREFRTRLISDVVTGKLDVREAATRLPDEIPEVEPLDEGDDLSQDEESAEIKELVAEDAA